MSKFLYIFLIFFNISSNLWGEDFISKGEYARMLYQNPRGIGCHKCHGEKGEGKAIANYKAMDKKANKMTKYTLSAPQINNLDLENFKKGIKNSKGMMPSYFLTDSEINTLFEYLQSLKKDEK